MSDSVQRIKQKINDLNKTEKECLTGMLMVSLRGSWRRPEQRIKLLEYVASQTSLDDKQRIIEKAESYYNNEYFDGRTFRYMDSYDRIYDCYYDRGTVEAIMEKVMSYVEGDLSWQNLEDVDYIYSNTIGCREEVDNR